MARVTYLEVQAIMENCSKTAEQMEPFITAANLLITNVFWDDTDDPSTLLKELERWMTAHMLATTICRTASEEKVGDVSVKYTGKWDKNLESTSYGQMVMQLDTTGKIGAIAKRSASIYAITSFE